MKSAKILKLVGVIPTYNIMFTRSIVIRDILNAISMTHLHIGPPLQIQEILHLRATAWVQGFLLAVLEKPVVR